MVPEQAWQIAVDEHGEVRERRADEACADLRCAHHKCWVEEAHVTELTGLLREHPAGDQLTLFEAGDGWRYTLWVTNLPARTRGWRGQLAYIDAAHWVHARVEDAIRTGKDCGIGKFPSHSLAMNKAWMSASLIAAALLAWLKLLALDGNLARAEPKTLRYRILTSAFRVTAART
jgi:Transposase DDE domain group 1